MINISDLTESDKGRSVRYTSFIGAPVEVGRIKTWNDKWIFVWYGSGDTATATNPNDLEFGS